MSNWVRRTVAMAAAGGLAACSGGPLDPHGPVAAGERMILFNAMAIMLVLVVPTLIGALVIAWWFRASNPRATYRPDFTFSGRLEILIWSIPTLIITFLGGLIWFGSHQLDPYRPLDMPGQPLEVQVVSLDWKWLFVYPGHGVASINEAVVPAGTPIHFTLTSSSVMNTFWVPQLAGMIYTMNGMQTQLYAAADHPGVFAGRSGHFSGDGFSDMAFTVRAVAPAEFEAWVGATKGTGPTLDRAAYETLARQSVPDRPSTYGGVEPSLFEAIVAQHIPPAPGPADGPSQMDVHPKTAER